MRTSQPADIPVFRDHPLSPSYVAETIRANFPDLEIAPKSNVRSIAGKR